MNVLGLRFKHMQNSDINKCLHTATEENTAILGFKIW